MYHQYNTLIHWPRDRTGPDPLINTGPKHRQQHTLNIKLIWALASLNLRLNQQHKKHRHIGFRRLSDSRAPFDRTEHAANVTLCNKLLAVISIYLYSSHLQHVLD
jgi:hypothetical protein